MLLVSKLWLKGVVLRQEVEATTTALTIQSQRHFTSCVSERKGTEAVVCGTSLDFDRIAFCFG